jgi:hypothetical protein
VAGPRAQVDCVERDSRRRRYEQVLFVGGPNAPGAPRPRWRLSEANAIAGIQSNQWTLFVRVGDAEVDVVVATSVAGKLYLKTTADHDTPDTLLRLPRCWVERAPHTSKT